MILPTDVPEQATATPRYVRPRRSYVETQATDYHGQFQPSTEWVAIFQSSPLNVVPVSRLLPGIPGIPGIPDIGAICDRLRKLRDNWDGQGSPAPTPTCVYDANALCEKLDGIGLRPDSIVPTVEGGVGLTFRNGTRFVSIEVCNDGDYVALEQQLDHPPCIYFLDPSPQGLAKLRGFLQSDSTTIEG